jgi:hypothetical protein
MPEPIKTRGKLERQGDWSLYGVVNDAGMNFIKSSSTTEANPVIDTACEVLNGWGDFSVDMTARIRHLSAALTTAGCAKELEVERFYIEENPTGKWGIVDSLNSEAGYLTQKGAVAKLNELNRIAQQAEGER